MPTLIAIGYSDETTAAAAAAEARGMAADREIEPEAIAVVSRDRSGAYQVETSALFLVVDPATSATAPERLRRYGGSVLTAPLGNAPERVLPPGEG